MQTNRRPWVLKKDNLTIDATTMADSMSYQGKVHATVVEDRIDKSMVCLFVSDENGLLTQIASVHFSRWERRQLPGIRHFRHPQCYTRLPDLLNNIFKHNYSCPDGTLNANTSNQLPSLSCHRHLAQGLQLIVTFNQMGIIMLFRVGHVLRPHRRGVRTHQPRRVASNVSRWARVQIVKSVD
jgi:hypothetical protein